MTLNTFVAGNSGSVRQLGDSLRNLGAGVEDTATGLHRARSESESDWQGEAGDAFREAADRDARDADRLAQLHNDLATALTAFADDLDTVNARMAQAQQVATAAKLRVQGPMIFPPDAASSAHANPGREAGALPDQRATATLYAQQAAYQEAEQTVNQARDMERMAHQRLQDALKANSTGLDHIGQRNAWAQAAATATTPAAAALAKAATAMDDWAANATHSMFEQALGAGPAQTKAVWDSLTPDQQTELKDRFPAMVGNANGLPAEVRSDANKRLLDQQRQALLSRLQATEEQLKNTPAEKGTIQTRRSLEAEISDLRQHMAGMDEIYKAAHQPDKYLLSLNSTANDGRGQVIIASGNPDKATNVVTTVPGTYADVQDAMQYVQRGDGLVDRAKAFAPPGQTFSSITYVGYESPPNLGDASYQSYADHAKDNLANFQEGLRVSHEGPTPSNNTVIGHSYGSTVAGEAARDHPGIANNLVFIGSPGVGVDHADQLGVPPEHVWAGTAQHDEIRNIPSANPLRWFDDRTRYGLEPYDPRFGANTLPTDPNAHHTDYWSRPESLDGMARVVADAPERPPQ